MTITSYEAITEGHELPVLHRAPQPVDLVKFAAVAEDFSRQHWDQPYMASLGFPNVIVHGWLTLTYMCQAVTAFLPPEVARILKYDARHLLPALPGEMSFGGQVVRKAIEQGQPVVELDLWARNAEGQIVTRGNMTLGFW